MSNNVFKPGPPKLAPTINEERADMLREFAERAYSTGKVSDEAYAEMIAMIEVYEKDHGIKR